jgi:hypothetical protein
VGALAGAIFGDSEERKRAEDDARRQRAQMVQELQRANNKLDRVNDNLNNGILADIPNRMTFGGDAVAATIQREQLRGAR